MDHSKDKNDNEKNNVNDGERSTKRVSPTQGNNNISSSVCNIEKNFNQSSDNVKLANDGIKIVGALKSSAIDVPVVVGSESKSQAKSNAGNTLGSFSSPGYASGSPGQPIFISGSPGQAGFIAGSPGSSNFNLGSPGQAFIIPGSPGQIGFIGGSPGQFGIVPGSPGQFGFIHGSPGQSGLLHGSPKQGFIPGSPSKGGLIFNFDDKQKQLLFDLAVVHECNLDKKFLVDPKHEPPKNLLHVLSDKIDSAFWDKLLKQLEDDPPYLDDALHLVSDIKQGLNSILLPWHSRIREEIAEVLDQDLIKQQAENGAFDFNKCANYIINLMAKLCAPVRDEGIEELKKIEGVVPSFKGIFEMLNLMRIDMINYHLIALRGELLRNGRKYERDKFDQYLKLSGCELVKTESWLNKYSPVASDKEKKTVLVKAFLELLDWDETKLNLEIPEPLCHDVHRILELGEEYFSIIITATIIVISGGYFSGKSPFDDAFKNSLKDNLLVLLKGINSYSLVERVMPNITEQIVKMVKDKFKSVPPSFSPEEERSSLSNLLTNINSSHPVWTLMKGRVNDAIVTIIATPKDKLPSLSLNSSLIHLTNEIQKLALSFSFLYSHSLFVYGDYMYKFLSTTDYKESEK